MACHGITSLWSAKKVAAKVRRQMARKLNILRGGNWQVLVTTLEEISSYRIGFLPLMLMVRAVMM